MSSTPTEADEWEPPARWPEFIATVTRRQDGTRCCTISPVPRSERLLLSEWVRADEGAFVPLEERR